MERLGGGKDWDGVLGHLRVRPIQKFESADSDNMQPFRLQAYLAVLQVCPFHTITITLNGTERIWISEVTHYAFIVCYLFVSLLLYSFLHNLHMYSYPCLQTPLELPALYHFLLPLSSSLSTLYSNLITFAHALYHSLFPYPLCQ